MIRTCVRLVAALNAVDAGELTVPEAEQQVAADALVHHGAQLDQVWPGVDDALPLRLLLSRLTRAQADELPAAQRGWGLVLARPGALGALRGPATLTQRVLASGPELAAVVVRRSGGVALQPLPLGATAEVQAVQWLVSQAQRPIFSLTPSDAAQALGSRIADASAQLDELGQVAGSRPQSTATVRLGRAYPTASQHLLDRALTLADAMVAGLGASSELIHSHAMTVRERALLDIRDAARDAIGAAASWPTQTLR